MFKPKYFIIDVDGVMTTGQFFYSEQGKMFKIFGPDDNDALSILSRYLKVLFVTGDRKGFKISKKRIVDDMGFDLNLVSTIQRKKWIEKKFDLNKTIYMGDGIFDYLVMKYVGYAICPANSDPLCKKNAKFQTKRSGGDRAVAEACSHILKKFFKKNIEDISLKGKFSGEWTA
ncbi:MAG: phosphatase [Flavobacteriales bacterium TMED235]|nr:MAG: phosphatase [Flavobacteriales bacterium TMED235]